MLNALAGIQYHLTLANDEHAWAWKQIQKFVASQTKKKENAGKGPQITWLKVDGKPVKLQEDKLDAVAQK